MTELQLWTLEQMARAVGCRPRLLERLFEAGVIEASARAEDAPRFDAGALRRVERALRLRQDLRVGVSALGLVLDLLERIESLERDLRRQRWT